MCSHQANIDLLVLVNNPGRAVRRLRPQTALKVSRDSATKSKETKCSVKEGNFALMEVKGSPFCRCRQVEGGSFGVNSFQAAIPIFQ